MILVIPIGKPKPIVAPVQIKEALRLRRALLTVFLNKNKKNGS